MVDELDPNRREALKLLAGSSFILALPRSAHGQDAAPLAALRPIFDDAAAIYRQAVSADVRMVLYEPDTLIGFIAADYKARRVAVKLIHEEYLNCFKDIEQYSSYLQALGSSFPDGIEGIPYRFGNNYHAMQLFNFEIYFRLNIEIIQDSQFATIRNIPAVPPPASDLGLDPDLIVAGDIVFEVLGLTVGQESLFVALLKADDGLRNAFEDMVKSVSSQDWEDVTESIGIILKILVGSAIIGKIVKKYGNSVFCFSVVVEMRPYFRLDLSNSHPFNKR